MKKILAFLTVIAMASGIGGARAQQLMAPDALVKQTTDEIISQIRKDKELVSNSRKLLDLVDAKVLPHFNFTRMTMLAVGRPWREATPAQREELVKQFRTLLVRTYSTALEQYSDQSIDVRPALMKPEDAETTVRTQIKQPGGPPIPMDYRMEKTPQGWKVFDVTVEGVSIVTTYRSSFATEVSKGGIDGLIKTIADQNARLERRAAGKK
ncbi:MAG: ABC transporter substrate-binding protein [Betaproteobacteria bacterium]|nr:MAG: ABC transporter substrate-binding protein [Betaproteobacteria bacterium]